uniref:metallophosphoesterase family protein n=1 Tax=Bacteroides caccae TaxID=47678 RepID=UPI00359C3202
MKRYLCYRLTIAVLLLNSCDMLETHPYDTHITGDTDINKKNIKRIEDGLKDKTTFRFAMISDTQRWYDETNDVIEAINRRGDVDFILHGGDQSDFGVTKEFIWMRDILNKLNAPYVCVIGNHDCLGTGRDTYRTIYGVTNFAFTAGNMRFICMNTNALEYDYSEPVPDFNFMDNELANMPEGIMKTAFLMHAAPKSDVFNNNVNEIFKKYVTHFPGLQFCMYGHSHSLSVEELFDDGVLYYQCPNINKRIYLLFTIHEEGYEYEAVEF